MRERKCVFLIGLLSCSQLLYAQYFTKYWDRCYGGSGFESLSQINISRTGEIYICGVSGTNLDGDKTQPLCWGPYGLTNDLWLLKVDKLGNILWEKDYGGPGQDSYPNITFTSSNKILVVAETNLGQGCTKTVNSIGGSSSNYWVMMLDTNGTVLWDKNFGSNYYDNNPKATELTNGEFIVCGYADGSISGDKTMANWGNSSWPDFWAVKFDSLGNKIWDHVYGGINHDEFSAILPSDNGSFVLGGTIYGGISGDISEQDRGGSDYWIVKVDNSGNKIWDKRLGGSSREYLRGMCVTPDNGFLLYGETSSPLSGDVSQISINGSLYQAWVVKLDSAGNKIWDRRYGGGTSIHGTIPVAMKPDPTGGYCMLAECSDVPGNDVTEQSFGYYDYLMIKIDDAGNKLWDKRIGAAGYDYPTSFVFLQDNSIIVCGESDTSVSACKSDTGHYGPNLGLQAHWDYWALRFKMTDNPLVVSSIPDKQIELLPYPNPSLGSIHFDCSIQNTGYVDVFNSQGELVIRNQKTRLDGNGFVDLSNFPVGLYFIRCWSESAQQTGWVLKI